MTFIITLFYLSLAVIVSMIAWKMVSLRELKVSLVEGVEHELHGKLYETVHEWWRILRERYYTRARAFTVALFYTVAHQVLHTAIVLGRKLGARFHVWYDMVKGKGEIRKKGSVSFFLKDVAEYKKSIQER